MSGYAVLKTGGRQYRVQPGDVLDVEKISAETGQQVELNEVLLINENDELLLGNPKVDGASVVAIVKSQHRGPKIIVFKYKNKTHYRRKNGHRQDYTRLEIQEIRSGIAKKKSTTSASASRSKTTSARKKKSDVEQDSTAEQVAETMNEGESNGT